MKKYIVEGEAFTLKEIIEANEFEPNDELLLMIESMQINETIGEGLNMAIITRIN